MHYMQGTLQQRRAKRTLKATQVPAIVCIGAIGLICLYSAFTIQRIVAASAPPRVAFTLGSAYRDVSYCNSQTLDLFIPRTVGASALPLAVFVHGGGLVSGDKGYLNPVFLNALASAGFAVASVNYRLAPQYKFPAQIEDVKCAIRYLRAHAGAHGVNGRAIFAFGTSYGGDLVALAALTAHQSVFNAGPYLDESSGLSAVADMFGPTNLPGWISSSDVQKIFGGNRAELILASPTHYVAAQAPPILIVQGVDDPTVPASQSIQLYDKLTASGDQTELVMVHNMGHMFKQVGPQPIDPSLAQIAQDMVAFFERQEVNA